MTDRNRKGRIIACILAGAVMCAGFPAMAQDTAGLTGTDAAQTRQASEQIIGGADGPTSVLLSGESGMETEEGDLSILDSARDDDGLKAEDWLPIGSVVLLNGANKTLMVMARFVYNNDDGLYYEYCGCLYPEGFGESRYYFFNHDDIALVAQKGYEDKDEKAYRETVLDRLNVALLNEQTSSETEADTEAETEG